MNAEQWAFQFAQQLHEQWPRVDDADLENLAESLWREARWQRMEPTQAALEWLRQANPGAGSAAAN